MKALVSILIPSYNGEIFIAETLRSCFDQSYPSIEIIIVDDKSKDGTVDWVKNNFQGRVKLIENSENLGLVKTVNKGVRCANGEYILILGQDDILPHNHIETMLEEFMTGSTVLVHCNSMLIDETGKEIRFSRNNEKQRFKTLNPMLYLSKDNFIQSCGMMFRKNAFLEIGGWEEKYRFFGEWLSYIKYAQVGEFRYCESTFTYYRKHTSSLIKKLNENSRKELSDYKQYCRLTALSKVKASFMFKLFIRLEIILKSLVEKCN